MRKRFLVTRFHRLVTRFTLFGNHFSSLVSGSGAFGNQISELSNQFFSLIGVIGYFGNQFLWLGNLVLPIW